MGSLRSLQTQARQDKKIDISDPDFWASLLVVIKEKLQTHFSSTFSVKRYVFEETKYMKKRQCINYHSGKKNPPIEEVYEIIQSILDHNNISIIRPYIIDRGSRKSSYIKVY